jgi:acylphosphatase
MTPPKRKAKAKTGSAARGGKPQAPACRARVFYSGRVQGVGFRHTAEEVALALGLQGWVRNLHDNRVEVVAEGSKEAIETFLDRIRSGHLGPHIKKCDCSWEKPTGEFSDFCVEFCF